MAVAEEEGLPKVDLLLQLAAEDPAHGIQYAESALSLAESLDYQKGVAKANEALGQIALDIFPIIIWVSKQNLFRVK